MSQGQRPLGDAARVLARAQLRAPPHESRRRNLHIAKRGRPKVLHSADHLGEIPTDAARNNMVPQFVVRTPGCDGVNDFRFAAAFMGLHRLFPFRKAANFRRARNSVVLTVWTFMPRIAAISSCDEPSAYAIHSASRWRASSFPIACSKSFFLR